MVRLMPAAYRRLRLDKAGRAGPGSRAFVGAYWLYKRWIEDPHAGLAKAHPEFFTGGDIIDVGANIGYTTSIFAKAIDPSCRVYSFEPEVQNFQHLAAVARRRGNVTAIRSAVGDHNGTCALRVNPHHPGDHQVVVGTSNDSENPAMVEVPLTSLDSFVAKQAPDRRVAFIKIDVQGHEAAVCRGMESLIRSQPAVRDSFEYSGSASDDVLGFFRDRGFKMSVVRRNGMLVDLTPEALNAAVAQRGYCDILAQR
jgi:FkbM family methyltransferase